jgi:FtsZ-binding cell division protein ZapB
VGLVSDSLVASLITAVLTTLGFIVTSRTSRKATGQKTEIALSAEARLWVTQAQTEVKDLKIETAAAKKEASEARQDADAAKREVREVRAEADGMMRWYDRVVRLAHLPEVADTDDPDVIRLLDAINGGPPGVSSSQLRRD